MEAVQHPQNLEKVERGIEQALRNFADREANGSELREITAGERIDKIGNMSALAIIEACETTAKDIEEAGQAAVDIAAEIMNEARQLAGELRANGSKRAPAGVCHARQKGEYRDARHPSRSVELP